MKNKYLLKNWNIYNILFYSVAQGNVYGNPKFEDGTFIHTSDILNFNIKEDHLEVETRNSIYCIYPEDIDTNFEKDNPGYYQELYDRMKRQKEKMEEILQCIE